MTNYDPQGWQVPTRETAWNQGGSSSRHNSVSSIASQREQYGAFNTQLEEIDRAYDNLVKSGKIYSMSGRRDSMPMMGAPPGPQFGEYAPRMAQRHSVDFDPMRPHSNSSNLQSYYANQRHQSRPNEGEQMMQAKRRMAAQRERDLRNYHQAQQYNRNVNVPGKSDGSASPTTFHEEERRELIARQQRALYQNDTGTHDGQGHARGTSGQGPSARAYDPFHGGRTQSRAQGHEEHAASQLNVNETSTQVSSKGPSPKPQQSRDLENSTASPASNPNSQTFGLFENAQHSSRTSTSSPGGSPPRNGKTNAPGPAPIGTRPTQAANPALNKRSGTPSQSPLSFGFTSHDALNPNANGSNERSGSSASNPTTGTTKESPASVWGSSSGVWGQSNSSTNNATAGGASASANKSLGAVWG